MMQTETSASSHMSFDKFFAVTEKHRWALETDVEWSQVRRDLVTDDELWTIRRAALVEGFSPRYGADLMAVYVQDAEMSSFLTIQLYEEFKHFHALRRYLHCCGVEISDEEVCAPRGAAVEYSDKLVPILKFGVSEIFTYVFYQEVSKQTQEPVLKKLARFIADDEKRHFSWYSSYLERYVKRHGVSADKVVEALQAYQHQGLDAIGEDWVELWNRAGLKYTGFEPYLQIKRLLHRVTGQHIDLKVLARKTSDRQITATYR